MSGNGLPTIREVARLAGVSVATVSKALNGSGKVSEELRGRVSNAARQLGYAPHASARSLRSGASRTLGLLIADITNPFFLKLVEAIEQRASAQGYSVLLCNSSEDPARERNNLRLLTEQRADGIILVPTREGWPGRVAELSRLKPPAILVDRLLDGLEIDSVTINNRLAGELAARHLLELGHRRTGVIMGSPDHQIARHRLDGYRDAFVAAGADFRPGYIEQYAFSEAQAYEAAGRLLSLPERPTALFATNNHLAQGMLRGILDADLRIPDDISVITIDDLPWSGMLRPGLTVVMQPSDAIAEAAIRILLGRVTGGQQERAAEPEQVVFDPALLRRGSTARLPAEFPTT
ncbi:LacI family DNA-binding transcriptional regulator [Mesorhizobium sp. L-8-3]|uniref:LacI family DNA-binding transcriptional regulator n=1 Tax=Mesorhizobium sp. L-8-3 TaxID=2744522 RepID=UPI0019258613|nr:LacI family DNA-binding transcriptional regulator [Mesorhizobium sp. L-8-3]BCH21450.1 LacI family transcriptional regulator [Mesorhizobium sp. L-8-3]